MMVMHRCITLSKIADICMNTGILHEFSPTARMSDIITIVIEGRLEVTTGGGGQDRAISNKQDTRAVREVESQHHSISVCA